ncbi:energy transducer TonB [Rhodoferax sp.]|uniref:energy transducer TonB n=1 Tax=Rhodoferax sp. TaxID=50421 RepID=UPI002ACE41ED|nr:energy transducer TonB [Rhodoferax sp.]MDZ7920563.1 energy transducer TonB [Rhodoferax sp.]
MTLRVPFRVQRTTGAAVLFSVVMHAFVLVGLTQYSVRPHVDQNLNEQVMRRPIEVMLLTEPMVAQMAMVTKVAPDTATHSIVIRPRQGVAAQTAPQTKLPTPSRDIHAESRPIEDVAYDLRMGVNPSDAPKTATPSKLIAGTEEQSRSEGHANLASVAPAEGQPDQRPTQGARPDYAYNPQPDYPILMREQGVGGVVWLRVWVDSDGRPVEIKLTKGSGYRLLDDAALRAVKLWRFIPAKYGDQRLASWVEFPIRFTLNS